AGNWFARTILNVELHGTGTEFGVDNGHCRAGLRLGTEGKAADGHTQSCTNNQNRIYESVIILKVHLCSSLSLSLSLSDGLLLIVSFSSLTFYCSTDTLLGVYP